MGQSVGEISFAESRGAQPLHPIGYLEAAISELGMLNRVRESDLRQATIRSSPEGCWAARRSSPRQNINYYTSKEQCALKDCPSLGDAD